MLGRNISTTCDKGHTCHLDCQCDGDDDLCQSYTCQNDSHRDKLKCMQYSIVQSDNKINFCNPYFRFRMCQKTHGLNGNGNLLLNYALIHFKKKITAGITGIVRKRQHLSPNCQCERVDDL